MYTYLIYTVYNVPIVNRRKMAKNMLVFKLVYRELFIKKKKNFYPKSFHNPKRTPHWVTRKMSKTRMLIIYTTM